MVESVARSPLRLAFHLGISFTFEGALFKTGEYQRGENKGNYPNPTRQRGIFGNTLETQNRNPSLTRRVGIIANAQLQNA